MMHLRFGVLFTLVIPIAGRRSSRIVDTNAISKTELFPLKWFTNPRLPFNQPAPAVQPRGRHRADRHEDTPTSADSRPAALGARGRPVVMNEEPSKVSPFKDPNARTALDTGGPLELTWDNVEMVLEQMRPYLLADGGNVIISDIDGGIVKLELQGACGTCPSSTMTLKMGLERGLREKIPEIISVEQALPDGADLDEFGVEMVLDDIRPFLKLAGGGIEVVDVRPEGVAPMVVLNMSGPASTANSVRAEIIRRLKMTFPSLVNVVFAD